MLDSVAYHLYVCELCLKQCCHVLVSFRQCMVGVIVDSLRLQHNVMDAVVDSWRKVWKTWDCNWLWSCGLGRMKEGKWTSHNKGREDGVL